MPRPAAQTIRFHPADNVVIARVDIPQGAPIAAAGASAASTNLEAVYEYAEPVRARGLVFMDTLGYEPVSVAGCVPSPMLELRGAGRNRKRWASGRTSSRPGCLGRRCKGRGQRPASGSRREEP